MPTDAATEDRAGLASPAGATTHYDSKFYEGQKTGSLASADLIVPMVLAHFSPQSVADIGCGVGGWAAAYARHGVPSVRGFDGDYVQRDMLEIDASAFTPVDLTDPPAFGSVDLVHSLEVAEHLPETSADAFVARLTEAAPVIVFSAAIPGQGGTHHVNEQWPSYWAAKFAERGYVTLDILRRPIWRDDRIKPWYRQNMLIFCTPDRVPDGVAPTTDLDALDLVHPSYGPLTRLGTKTRVPGSIKQSVTMIGLCLGVIARQAAKRLTGAR